MSWAAAIQRAVVKIVTSSTKMQTVQTESLLDYPDDDVEHFEPYGYQSRPFSGSEAVVLHVGGDADHPIVIVVADRRYRMTTLAEGEVAISDDQGQKVHLTRSGIVVDTSGNVDITGGGSITVDATVLAQMKGASVVLGEAAGALGVARQTDAVTVAVPKDKFGTGIPAAATTLDGTITGGSTTVFAAG